MNRSTESCLKNLLMVYQYFIISDLFTLRWIVGSYFIWLNIVRFFTTHIIWAANYHYVPHKHLQNDNLLTVSILRLYTERLAVTCILPQCNLSYVMVHRFQVKFESLKNTFIF